MQHKKGHHSQTLGNKYFKPNTLSVAPSRVSSFTHIVPSCDGMWRRTVFRYFDGTRLMLTAQFQSAGTCLAPLAGTYPQLYLPLDDAHCYYRLGNLSPRHQFMLNSLFYLFLPSCLSLPPSMPLVHCHCSLCPLPFIHQTNRYERLG